MDQENVYAMDEGEELGEIGQSSPSTSCSLNNLKTSVSVMEHRNSNRDISDPVKYLDFQRMLIDQEKAMTALKISEYEKTLAVRDQTIMFMHTTMMNYQNNNHVLTNQWKNIMEKTKSVSDTCQSLNTSFASICDHLNKLGGTVDNARTRQKDVSSLVEQSTKIFQEKISNVIEKIDDSIKHVNMEKMREKHELETLENKYSLDLIAYKSNLEESTKQIENLKTENNLLLENLNETNSKLNEQKEMVTSLNQNFEKVIKDLEDQNVVLIGQNKSLNDKCVEILNENQSLKDEISAMNISLEENKKQLDVQLTVIKEQTALLEKLKTSEELNDVLKKDKFSLNEHNEYLEKLNASLIEDMSKTQISHKEIQEETQNKYNNMCKKYDDLLKMLEEKNIELTEKLQLQNEKEGKIQAEVIDLIQLVEVSNKTIFNLQEEIKANHILIPELQRKIDEFSANCANDHQMLQDSIKENIVEISKLNDEKIELLNQSKDHFNTIEKLTVNYMKYKSKAKKLYVEVMRLRFLCSQSEQKNSHQQPLTSENVDVLSEEDVDMEDVDLEDEDTNIVEFHNKDVLNMDGSTQSISNKMNKAYSSTKRNASPLKDLSNSKVKKYKTSVDNISSRANIEYNQTFQNKDIKQSQPQSSTRQKEKSDENNENKNQVKSNINSKKTFKIPSDMKPPNKKQTKPTNMQNIDWPKPNSPVFLTPASPTRKHTSN